MAGGGGMMDFVGPDSGTEPASGGAAVELDNEERHDLVVVGHGRIVKPKHAVLVAPESVLACADVASLRDAAGDPNRCCGGLPALINVALVEIGSFDEDLYVSDHVRLEVDDHTVYALVSVLLTGERAEVSEYLAWLQPAARALGCEIASVRFTDEYGQEDSDHLHLPLTGDERQELLNAARARPRYIDVRIKPSGSFPDSSILSDVSAGQPPPRGRFGI